LARAPALFTSALEDQKTRFTSSPRKTRESRSNWEVRMARMTQADVEYRKALLDQITFHARSYDIAEEVRVWLGIVDDYGEPKTPIQQPSCRSGIIAAGSPTFWLLKRTEGFEIVKVKTAIEVATTLGVFRGSIW